MEYAALSENELLDILATQTALYTDFLSIGSLTAQQIEAKKIIDDIVKELSTRKETERSRA
jgi:hypothetical protein